MKKHYQLRVTREEYLRAVRCGIGSTEEILTVLSYLRESDIVLTYLRSHICKEKFGRPVISADMIGYIEDRPLESTKAFLAEIDMLNEWIFSVSELFDPHSDDMSSRPNRFAQLANHHVGVYTEVYSFEDEPVPYDQMRYTEHVYFDVGNLIIEV